MSDGCAVGWVRLVYCYYCYRSAQIVVWYLWYWYLFNVILVCIRFHVISVSWDCIVKCIFVWTQVVNKLLLLLLLLLPTFTPPASNTSCLNVAPGIWTHRSVSRSIRMSREPLLSMSFDHDSVIKWKHFPHYWPFVWGIHRWPVNSNHKGQWRTALMHSLICACSNGWVNNRCASDLRRHRAHYNVTVMMITTGDLSQNFPYLNIEMKWINQRRRQFNVDNPFNHPGSPMLLCLSTTLQTQNLIITSKRRFDVISTCLLHCVFPG